MKGLEDVLDTFFSNCFYGSSTNSISSDYILTTSGTSVPDNYELGYYQYNNYPIWDNTVWYNYSFPEINIPKFPLSNCYIDKKGTVFIEIALAGYKKEDIDVEREDNKLIITGFIKNYDEKKDIYNINEKYKEVWRNISKKNFKVTYKLSSKLDLSKINIKYEDGILSIEVPMKKEFVPIRKKIEIK